MSMLAFRMVETQHVAATMRLVDSAVEQDLLENMLEPSKPPIPASAKNLHYLLAAPFRYLPATASRFRSVGSPGIWYGADDAFCACAETAYWRQRFLRDSVGLAGQHLSTEHTIYEAQITGAAIDLLAPPWSSVEPLWVHPTDYTNTHQLVKHVVQCPPIDWIHYRSVRAPGHTCAAVVNPQSLAMVADRRQFQQWHCHVTQENVSFSNGSLRYDFKNQS